MHIKRCLDLVVRVLPASGTAHIIGGTFKRSCTFCREPDCFFDCEICLQVVNQLMMYEEMTLRNRRFNADVAIIERLIEFHAGMGIDIESQEYQSGITKTIALLELNERLRLGQYESPSQSLAPSNPTPEVIEGEPEER